MTEHFTRAEAAESAAIWLSDWPVREWTDAQITDAVLTHENYFDGCDCDAEWRAAVLTEVIRLVRLPVDRPESWRERRDRLRYEAMHAAGRI